MRDKHAFVYAVRNEILISFGYRSYKQYLKSEEWAAIRAAVLADYEECVCCTSKSQVVHHVKYDSATLLGLHRANLAPLCKACHDLIELDEAGEKGSLARANTMMLDMARKKDPKQLWLQRFYKDRRPYKKYTTADVSDRKKAWRRKRDEKEQETAPRDYSGVFWIRARRRR